MLTRSITSDTLMPPQIMTIIYIPRSGGTKSHHSEPRIRESLSLGLLLPSTSGLLFGLKPSVLPGAFAATLFFRSFSNPSRWKDLFAWLRRTRPSCRDPSSVRLWLCILPLWIYFLLLEALPPRLGPIWWQTTQFELLF